MRSSNRDIDASRSVLALVRAEVRVSRVLEQALSHSALTPQKFNVLMELAVAPDARLPLCDIGRRLLKSAPNITTLVDRLEADGLVRRVRDVHDRRMVLAEITERGWDALRPATRDVFAGERRILRTLSAKDRRDLVGLLGRVAELSGPSESTATEETT